MAMDDVEAIDAAKLSSEMSQRAKVLLEVTLAHVIQEDDARTGGSKPLQCRGAMMHQSERRIRQHDFDLVPRSGLMGDELGKQCADGALEPAANVENNHVAFCLLPSTFCLLPSAFCLLPSAFCLLPSTFCL